MVGYTVNRTLPSLGVTFRSFDGKEADLVLWAGGWADMNGSINGEIVYLFPDFSDVTSCVSATEALVNRLGPPK